MKLALKTALMAFAFAAAGAVHGAGVDELLPLCDGCHGPGGVSAHPDVPTIAGQAPSFLKKTLRTYQVWGRPCVKSEFRHGDTTRSRTDMCQVAEGLTSEDMEALATHYGAQAFQAAQQPFDAALAQAGAELHEANCEQCHAAGGTEAGSAPILAGQWTEYLRSSIKFVPTGEHLVPPLMERKVSDLAAEEIDALMNFYASQQN